MRALILTCDARIDKHDTGLLCEQDANVWACHGRFFAKYTHGRCKRCER